MFDGRTLNVYPTLQSREPSRDAASLWSEIPVPSYELLVIFSYSSILNARPAMYARTIAARFLRQRDSPRMRLFNLNPTTSSSLCYKNATIQKERQAFLSSRRIETATTQIIATPTIPH